VPNWLALDSTQACAEPTASAASAARMAEDFIAFSFRRRGRSVVVVLVPVLALGVLHLLQGLEEAVHALGPPRVLVGADDVGRSAVRALRHGGALRGAELLARDRRVVEHVAHAGAAAALHVAADVAVAFGRL